MQYVSTVSWQRNGKDFAVKTYDRTHQVQFAGGTSFAASSAPEFLGRAELPNPEELFTAAISSCFMLTFLYWAALKNVVIENYSADAVGTLAKNADGKIAISTVVIKPKIIFQNNVQPDATVLEELFKKAHDNCFISNSVKSTITVEAQAVTA